MRDPGRRSLRAALVLAACALAGCDARPAPPASATPLAGLRGRLLGLSGSLVLAGPEWAVDAAGHWRSTGRQGTFDVRVEGPSREDLVLVLWPAPEARFEVRWDGEPAPVEVVGGRRRVVTVPAAALTPGRHELRLVSPSKGAPLALRRIVLRPARAAPVALAAADLERDQALGQLAELGLAGRGARWRDGFATLGAWSERIDLGRDDGGTFVALVANLSGARARFVARRPSRGPDGEAAVEIEPGGDGVLRLEVPAGERRIELDVAGPPPGGAALWGGPYFVPVRARVPAVVVLTLDTTRRDALGAFGAPAGATPRLDRFARGATVYRRASSSTSWTLPAHASLFTGLYPVEHGAGVTRDLLARDFETLAERLGARYVTAGLAGGALLRHGYGVGQGFGLYEVPERWETPGRALADRALDLLAELDGLPLFLFVNLFDPHYPYLPPADSPRAPELAAAAARIPAGSRWRELARGSGEAWRDLLEGRIAPEAAGVAALRAGYAAEVAEADRQAGRILDELERRGLLDAALVVVASDHGEFLGERGLFSHSARLDPELVDIPLIVKYPGQRDGRAVDLPVSLVDLFPTVLRAGGVAATPGRGLLLTDERALAARAGVLFEETEHAIHPLLAASRLDRALTGFDGGAGRRVEWSAGEECHDGAPPQRRVLPCTPVLRAAHAAQRGEVVAGARRPAAHGESELDPEERARLEALGYL